MYDKFQNDGTLVAGGLYRVLVAGGFGFSVDKTTKTPLVVLFPGDFFIFLKEDLSPPPTYPSCKLHFFTRFGLVFRNMTVLQSWYEEV